MGRVLVIALVAALVPATACNSVTLPDDIVAALSMGPSADSIRTFTSTTSGRTVTVLGGIYTPVPCYTYGATTTTAGNVIDATVQATSMPGTVCIGVTSVKDYTLTLTGMPVGSWTLRVSNQEGSSTPEQKYETAVTISK